MIFNYAVFKTFKNKYLYDGMSGNIFEITDSFYDNHKDVFMSFLDTNLDKNNNYWREVNNLRKALKNNSLMAKPNSDIRYWFDIDDYKKVLYENIDHLMIGITEKCNMRCSYCVYGGHYVNERFHSNKQMSFDTLEKSIDFFFEISNKQTKIVNLYGGEPLVSFDSIKHATDYVRMQSENTKIYITTNGTLLNEAVSEWFMENTNVHLFVSLAGIPNRHDELRVLANGNPTFNQIRKNLMRIKESDPVAYRDRVNIIFNVFDEIQLTELQEFWMTDSMFKGMKNLPEISFIDLEDEDGTITKIRDRIINEYNSPRNLLDEYISLLMKKEYDNLIVKHYDDKLMRIHRRLTDCGENILAGICKPFMHKMYVDVNGNLHLCENFTYGNIFGDVYDDFSMKPIERLLDSYKHERNKTCSTCWASKLCSLCFRDLYDRNGSINRKRAEKLCENERDGLKHLLSEYCTVLEHDTTLLDHMDNYIVHM